MNTNEYRKETAVGIGEALESVEDKQLDKLIDAIKTAPRLFFSGAGRSFLMIKAMAMAMMQIGYQVYVTGEVATPSIQSGDLLVVASCSGTTKSVLLFVEQAKHIGAKVALITGNANSQIGDLSDIVIEMEYRSKPGSIQETWIVDNRFEQSIVPLGDCIVEALAREKGASTNTIQKNHANME